MALILLRKEYAYVGELDQGSYKEYVYRTKVYNFNTDTGLVEEGSFDETFIGTHDAPQDYSRPLGEVFHTQCLPGTTTKRRYYHNGLGGFTLQDEANSVDCGYVPPTYPTAGTHLRNACNGHNLQQVLADGGGGETWGNVVEHNSAACGYVAPFYGCMDPDATNYDPLATVDNGLCVFGVRMTATMPAALAVVGNPIVVELASGETGKQATRASMLLTVGTLSELSQVQVNGSMFRFSLTPVGGEFYNAETLAQAMQEDVVLSQVYTITHFDTNKIKLDALRTGSAYTPVTASADASITIVVTKGVDALRSQTKRGWGCYVELWACAGSYGSDISKEQAVLLGRLDRLYIPENSYRFGLESMLRQTLRHGLFSEADRLQAYFVRYGEMYLPTGQVQPKRYPLGESRVLWAMEGALPFSQPNELAAPLLLNRCTERQSIPLHGYFYAEALYALAAGGTRLKVEARFLSYDGTATIETIADTTPATGGVVKLPLSPVFARALQLDGAKKLLRCTVTLTASLGAATTTLGTLSYTFSRYTPHSKCLVFVSSLAAYESVWLEGVPESSTKRSATTYSKGTAGISTLSGSAFAVSGVALEESIKLSSTLLDKEAFDYLRRELAASPDVFLFDALAGTYTSVNISGMELKADETEQEYFASFDLEPGVPFNPLRN